ncbi:MAG: archease [Verrucomicrobiae bacterium]|nr:archease [Verrucomicrobiae bacterium]
MLPRPSWLIPLEHVADVGIQVSAATLEQLYERCAWGMFYELTDLGSVRPKETREIEIRANGYESLLVEWLSELNYIHTVEHYLFCSFEVNAINENFLRATASGEKYNSSRHLIQNEIKAVTYHLLKVKACLTGGWRAEVLFDV